MRVLTSLAMQYVARIEVMRAQINIDNIVTTLFYYKSRNIALKSGWYNSLN